MSAVIFSLVTASLRRGPSWINFVFIWLRFGFVFHTQIKFFPFPIFPDFFEFHRLKVLLCGTLLSLPLCHSGVNAFVLFVLIREIRVSRNFIVGCGSAVP